MPRSVVEVGSGLGEFCDNCLEGEKLKPSGWVVRAFSNDQDVICCAALKI